MKYQSIYQRMYFYKWYQRRYFFFFFFFFFNEKHFIETTCRNTFVDIYFDISCVRLY